MNPVAEIHNILEDALDPDSLRVTDNSPEHAGHAGAQSGKGHYTVEIATRAFAGKSRLDCHRMIYQALGTLMDEKIHALRILII